MVFNIPRLSKKDIIKAADDFRSQYGRLTGKVFLIEEVIELDLGIDIVHMPKLRTKFEVDAFTTGDFSQIVVDDELLLMYPGRYRFTLAHEIGHRQLHMSIFKDISFGTVDDWAALLKSVSTADYNSMEKQSDAFASHVLIPESEVKNYLHEKRLFIKETVGQFKGLGLKSDDIRDLVAKRLVAEMAEVFGVSALAATNRIKYSMEFIRMVV